jgi:putative aldouronate transport system permease protein
LILGKGGWKLSSRNTNVQKGKFLNRLKANKELLILSIPGGIWFLLFAYLPLFGVVIAFKKFRFSGSFLTSLIKSEFVGFDNFKFLFSSGDAWIIVRNTVLYNAAFIILGIVLPVIVALMLNEIHNKGMAKIYQSSLFLPYFLSWVVVSYCLFAFLNPEKGYFNTVLQHFGADPVSWYSEKKYWPFIIIFMSQWKGIGYNTVVYLASICGIDRTYYEAAVLDGASKWQQIKYITMPMLKPVITILLIMSVGGIFRADFGLFYHLPKDSGPLYPMTNVLDTYIYRALKTNGEIGMSSAAALFQSTVGFVMIMIANKIVTKVDSDNALF